MEGVERRVGVVGVVAEFVHEEGVAVGHGARADDGFLVDGVGADVEGFAEVVGGAEAEHESEAEVEGCGGTDDVVGRRQLVASRVARDGGAFAAEVDIFGRPAPRERENWSLR